MPGSCWEQMVSVLARVFYDVTHTRLGAHSWVRKAMGIQLEGGQTGNARAVVPIPDASLTLC